MNPVVVENQLAGTSPSIWDIPDTGDGTFKYGDPAIQGYAVPFSVNLGQTVTFKVKLTSTPIPYHIDIYRLGYYGGLGARKVVTIPSSQTNASQTQPNCTYDTTTGLLDCGNWSASATWTPVAPLVSGIYIAKLVREDIQSKGSHIVFVVRDDSRVADILAQTSDTTWHAYNSYYDPANQANQNSLYGPAGANYPNGRAYKVSYNRPFDTRSRPASFGAQDFIFSDEYPMHRWLEASGYDVKYSSGQDTDATVPTNCKIFMSIGHDEYWSKSQRNNAEAARANGTNLAFFSGNESFWKTRWENDVNGQKRILVCYKESFSETKIDPTNIWTGTWRDPLGANYDAGIPENEMSGTLYTVNGTRLDNITVPAPYRSMRLWRFTQISQQPTTDPASVLANYTLGFEWDIDPDNGFRPPWPAELSSTTLQINGQLVPPPSGGLNNGDPGTNTSASGSATHSLMSYRHASGALVFGAGTTRWSWGLDATHDAGDIPQGNPAPTTDLNIQQATVNLLADMGVLPQTPASNLVPSSRSNDTVPPVTTITNPAANANLPQNTAVQITGTATDAAGRVCGVEVSVNGGTTWRPTQPTGGAQGFSTWTFTWTPTTTGSATIKSRGVDDSLNQETPGPGVGVTVVATATQSLWPNNPTPTLITVNDANAVELGVKFQASRAGSILGIRFYKGPQNTGTHVGSLWNSSGTRLAQVTFTGETASGWQQMNFATPVSISANTTYIASYHTSGFYSDDRNYFTNAYTSGSLTALADGSSGGNGVYLYGSGGFPTNSYQASNYWVDVVFQ
jgi:Domain of unknown function (DUF4082)/Bacterial Ig domain